ncbi:hypothetical protein EDD22DRAFT_853064 [Suillus occidentalis]|nr:hypothetical protein EDD22DRAFT_853064 [Suillus occidentalis]
MAGFPPAGPGWPQMNLDIEFRCWLANSDSNDSDSRRHEISLPQPQHSVPQELRLPGPALGGGDLSTQLQLHSNPHSNESVHWQVHGGSRHPINFDAPFNLSQPFAISVPQEVDLQRTMLHPAISLSHEQAPTGNGQVMAEATLSSFLNTQNFDSQRFDPSVGTSQVISETPLPASLAGSQDIYQVQRPVSPLLQLESRMGISLRHTVSNEALGSSRRIDPPLTQFQDTTNLTRSQQQPFPTYQQDIQNLHLPLMDYLLQQEMPTATSQLNLKLLPHFIPMSQDPSIGNHTVYGKHGKDSSSLLGSHCAQEDMKSRLGHQRGVTGRRKFKERSGGTKFIVWTPNTDDTAQSIRTKKLQTIMVQSQSLVEDKSHTLMVTSLFEKGFFPTEGQPLMIWLINTLAQMVSILCQICFVFITYLTTAEDLRRWMPSQKGSGPDQKVEVRRDLPSYLLLVCVDLCKNKEEMAICGSLAPQEGLQTDLEHVEFTDFGKFQYRHLLSTRLVVGFLLPSLLSSLPPAPFYQMEDDQPHPVDLSRVDDILRASAASPIVVALTFASENAGQKQKMADLEDCDNLTSVHALKSLLGTIEDSSSKNGCDKDDDDIDITLILGQGCLRKWIQWPSKTIQIVVLGQHNYSHMSKQAQGEG